MKRLELNRNNTSKCHYLVIKVERINLNGKFCQLQNNFPKIESRDGKLRQSYSPLLPRSVDVRFHEISLHPSKSERIDNVMKIKVRDEMEKVVVSSTNAFSSHVQ